MALLQQRCMSVFSEVPVYGGENGTNERGAAIVILYT